MVHIISIQSFNRETNGFIRSSLCFPISGVEWSGVVVVTISRASKLSRVVKVPIPFILFSKLKGYCTCVVTTPVVVVIVREVKDEDEGLKRLRERDI